MTTSGAPSARTLPKSRTIARSASWITALITCSTHKMAVPSLSRTFRAIWTEAASSASLRPAITSSSSSTLGCPASAFASSRNRSWWRFRLQIRERQGLGRPPPRLPLADDAVLDAEHRAEGDVLQDRQRAEGERPLHRHRKSLAPELMGGQTVDSRTV